MVRLVPAPVMGAIVMLFLAAPASAQILGAGADTLWAHAENPGTCCTYWASTVQDEGTTSLVAATAVPDERIWEIPVTGGFEQPVELDPEGMVHFEVEVGPFDAVGAGAGVSAGVVDVSADLLLGTTVVASTPAETWIATPSVERTKFTWDVAPSLTSLAPSGGDLVFRVNFQGSGVLLGLSFAPGATFVQLPLATPSDDLELPTIHYEDLPQGDASIETSFQEPTNDLYIYNWTTDQASILAEIGAEVQNGTAFFAFVDENDEAIVEGELTADIQLSEELDGRAVRYIAVAYEDFVGTFRLTTTEAPAEPEQVETPDGGEGNETLPPEGDTGTDTNTTADPQDVKQEGDAKDTSALGLVALLGAVAVALVGRRR